MRATLLTHAPARILLCIPGRARYARGGQPGRPVFLGAAVICLVTCAVVKFQRCTAV